MSVSPQVIKVGETITASAGPATDQCGGPASSVSWTWGYGGEVVAGCGETAPTCEWRAESPTGTPSDRWSEICIDGNSPFGGWYSCEYYAVTGHGGQAKIHGQITTPFGDGLANVNVELSGTEDQEATTNSEGSYSFAVEPGTYSVTPAVTGAGEDEYEVGACEGEGAGGSCAGIEVEQDQESTANFSAGYTLSGKVSGVKGEASEGVEVVIQDEEQGHLKTVTAKTGSEGIFSERLAPGKVTATAKVLEVGKEKVQFFPDPSEDCKVANSSCAVELDRDRKADFSACVVPNPNGEALPPGTPEPIPGAQKFVNLEAVGCWTEQPDGTFTSTKPVRLDGIDVAPASGTTIVLHSDQTVTSEGPASIDVGGYISLPVDQVDLNFQAAAIQAGDLGTGNPTFGLNTRVKGIPFSLSTGSTLQTLVPPWQSSLGKTTLNLDLQLPTTLAASEWNVFAGTFAGNGGTTVPSIGATIALTVNNREGLIAPQLCGKFTGGEFKLWNTISNTSWIKQATVCYDLHEHQWTLAGLFQLPEGWKVAKFANQVNASISLGEGFTWTAGAIEADGINLELADGFFLQRLGAKFTREASTGTVSSISGTIGTSFGPQLNTQTAGPLVRAYPAINDLELMSLDGEFTLGLTPPPAYIKATGNILLLRNTPLQFALAGGYVQLNTNGRIDLGGELHEQLPVVHWGLDGQMSGFWDSEQHALQISGTDDVTGPWGTGAKAQTLISNKGLVACLAVGGSYAVGAAWEWGASEPKTFTEGTCDIGSYRVDGTSEKSAGASSSRVGGGARSFELRLPSGLAGTTIAVRGVGAPPIVELHGAGLSLRTPPGGGDLLRDGVFIYKQQANDTTYISLAKPRGGEIRVVALPGSSRIASVRGALPAARAKVKARVAGTECRRTVTYRASVPHGESVALYAQSGGYRTFLGDARRRGVFAFTPETAAAGTGQIMALEQRGSLLRSVSTVATFKTYELTGPERVSGLRLVGRKLSWKVSCDASAYAVKVRQGKRTIELHSSSPGVTLPRLSRPFAVSVTAIDAQGAKGPAAAKTYGLARRTQVKRSRG
jgi:Carboxypeptidase regulatory-like domain